MSDWHLYVVKTRAGDLYTGVTTDVTRRFREHAAGGGRGARFLRSRGPLQLVFQVRLGSRSLALRAEYRLRKLNKLKKQEIIDQDPSGGELLAMLDLSRDRDPIE
ncbi:MAG: GIY-YIG nuclease family protein [Gammaproteobacteria bacterium]|nr:GIY-YIG nuclease family protein [Gammaproteobacteria bacterium]